MKLNFCPIDFETINENNLAYELVYAERYVKGGTVRKWTWQAVLDETIVGLADTDGWLLEGADKRYNFMQKPKGAQNYDILLESKKRNGICSLEMLKNIVDQYKDSQEDFDERIILDYETDGDTIVFFGDSDRLPIMTAIPCCPFCHSRLPMGWKDAEDFGAIALLSPAGCGKTVFLYTMLHENWKLFRNIKKFNGNNIHIAPAYDVHDETEYIYREIEEKAKLTCKNYGHCPDHTERYFWIPPVFLNVRYNNHSMIIGIYDNAGEEMIDRGFIKDKKFKILLKNMFAEMYLFTPEDFIKDLPKKKKKMWKQAIKECKMYSIEEQGRLQSDHTGETVFAEEILRSDQEVPSDSKIEFGVYRAFSIYDNHIDALMYNAPEKFEELYFMGILSKADLLENMSKVTNNPEYQALFKRTSINAVSYNQILNKSLLTEQMISEVDLIEQDRMNAIKDTFNTDERDSVFWYCVSSLGCDAEDAGKLEGEFNPLGIVEPLMTCIGKRIVNNNWN